MLLVSSNRHDDMKQRFEREIYNFVDVKRIDRSDHAAWRQLSGDSTMSLIRSVPTDLAA